jgi:hypothetical protein
MCNVLMMLKFLFTFSFKLKMTTIVLDLSVIQKQYVVMDLTKNMVMTMKANFMLVFYFIFQDLFFICFSVVEPTSLESVREQVRS